ncbi:MAG: gamma-glutamyltransferase [Pseudomonadota bacterium]
MRLLLGLIIVAWVLPATAQQAEPSLQFVKVSEKPDFGWSSAALQALAQRDAGQPVTAPSEMVAAANPLAVEAGTAILAAGGTAADALVAVQLVLGLVEPQSSGLGGGAFLLYFDAAKAEVVTLDGRETAPMAATPQLFQDANGEPLQFFDAVVGGRSVGTPGTPALLSEAHARWGRLPWPQLFEDAVALAEGGFTVSPRLATLIERDAERLGRFPDTGNYFLPNGAPLQAGDTLQNAAYAATLRAMADGGAGVFYAGAIAQDIVTAVQTAPGNPGVLSQQDLAIYTVKERPPVCAEYRDHNVCGMGPPSSGGLTVGQILGLLAPYDMAALGPDNPESWRLIGDASRLAFADRGRYMADSDFVPMPTTGLIDPAYLTDRARQLDSDSALAEVAPGTPAFDHSLLWADDESLELPSTSHISIVDKDGNVASMTTTIENAFGARLMVRGFLLNNELTDFSFRTHRDGVPIANALAPGKRPRSSMAPTIVLKDGVPVIAIGSPGGSRIIGYVAKTIIGMLDWGLDVQAAIDLPNAVNRFGAYDLEDGTAATDLAPALKEMGYDVNARALTSGLHGIAIGDRLQGGADRRREGIALGR